MFVRAPANTDLAATFADLDAIGGVIRTSTVSGATGHHAHGADDFVRQRQDNHHRGITSHGLYASCSYGEAVLSAPAPIRFLQPIVVPSRSITAGSASA
jgi:hypothetical protein